MDRTGNQNLNAADAEVLAKEHRDYARGPLILSGPLRPTSASSALKMSTRLIMSIPVLRTAVVTGAGSGVGQATALKLAQQGWRVALVGRRAKTLNQTVKLAGKHGKQFLVCSCDIGKVEAVERMAKRVLAEFEEVEVLVNSAGTNAPRRALEVLSLEDYHAMIA